MPAQRDLVCRGKILVSEQQKLVIEECSEYARELIVTDGLSQIHANDFSAEGRTNRTDLEPFVSHRVSPGFDK